MCESDDKYNYMYIDVRRMKNEFTVGQCTARIRLRARVRVRIRVKVRIGVRVRTRIRFAVSVKVRFKLGFVQYLPLADAHTHKHLIGVEGFVHARTRGDGDDLQRISGHQVAGWVSGGSWSAGYRW